MRLAAPLFLAIAALGVPVFAQPQRVSLEASGASVEAPAGWSQLPATGSPPVVMFNLCDPSIVEGCLVRGEMMLSAPRSDENAETLEERLATSRATQSPDRLVVPVQVQSGRYVAIETFWQGPHSSHISKIVKRGTRQIRTPVGWYDCMLTADPELFATQIERWRSFCASLDTTAVTDNNSHG